MSSKKITADKERQNMSVEKVELYLRKFGAEKKIKKFEKSTATVEEAAKALNCEPARIAKTLSLYADDRIILIVAAGDTKIDNKKFKAQFGVKAKMLSWEEDELKVGYKVGGVCPFAVNYGGEVYLDQSLKRFPIVYPAAGDENSAVELTIPELEQYSGNKCWVDVCK